MSALKGVGQSLLAGKCQHPNVGAGKVDAVTPSVIVLISLAVEPIHDAGSLLA
jgi:hypothetical protein